MPVLNSGNTASCALCTVVCLGVFWPPTTVLQQLVIEVRAYLNVILFECHLAGLVQNIQQCTTSLLLN